MLHAAFFRNMNLGQARSLSPTRAVLEEAFRSAGARQVRSFQTNGTVAFDPVDRTPADVVAHARARLHAATGYTDIAPHQPLTELAVLVEHTRAALEVVDRAVYATFFDPAPRADWAAPEAVLDRLGTSVLASGPGWVVTMVAPGGDPTTAVQAKLGQRATTRGFGTVERLLRAVGADLG